MIQILHEVSEAWSTEGALKLHSPSISGEIKISPEMARQRAKGYLTTMVALSFRPGEPVLVWQERPAWRMPISLHLRYWGEVAVLGTIDVDALTGNVLPIPSDQITTMQDRADAIASRLTPETAPTS